MWGDGFGNNVVNCIPKGNDRLILLTEPPNGHGTRFGLVATDHENRRDLGQAVVSDLAIDLLVPGVQFRANARRAQAHESSPSP